MNLIRPPLYFDESIYGLFDDLIRESLGVRSHFELFLWFQGNLQRFLPHEIMIAAWGDFSTNNINVDIISAIPGVRSAKIAHSDLTPLLKRLFVYWSNHARAPYTLSMAQGIFGENELALTDISHEFKNMRSVLVHALKDKHGQQEYLYAFMSKASKIPANSRKVLETILPYIDFSFRQLEQLPEEQTERSLSGLANHREVTSLLSSRELEIMNWVIKGKTNKEIGLILSISFFTVKNHLQRIYKKLDVTNRAQAANTFDEVYPD